MHVSPEERIGARPAGRSLALAAGLAAALVLGG
jgi:hypothetical protein